MELLANNSIKDTIPVYVTINRALVDRSINDYYAVVDSAERQGFRAIKCAPFETVVLDPEEWETTLQKLDMPPDPDSHIFLQFPESGITDLTGEIADVPDAFGISGGGIWAIHQNTSGLWSPDYAKLIGIQYSWYESLRLAKANQIQHLLALIATGYVKLQQYLI